LFLGESFRLSIFFLATCGSRVIQGLIAVLRLQVWQWEIHFRHDLVLKKGMNIMCKLSFVARKMVVDLMAELKALH
jgi:hypothetical protein